MSDMSGVRRVGAAMVGAASVVVGLAGAWYVTGSAAIGAFPTLILVGLLGLALLPLALLVATRLLPPLALQTDAVPSDAPEEGSTGDDAPARRSEPAGRRPERADSHRHRFRHANV